MNKLARILVFVGVVIVLTATCKTVFAAEFRIGPHLGASPPWAYEKLDSSMPSGPLGPTHSGQFHYPKPSFRAGVGLDVLFTPHIGLRISPQYRRDEIKDETRRHRYVSLVMHDLALPMDLVIANAPSNPIYIEWTLGVEPAFRPGCSINRFSDYTDSHGDTLRYKEHQKIACGDMSSSPNYHEWGLAAQMGVGIGKRLPNDQLFRINLAIQQDIISRTELGYLTFFGPSVSVAYGWPLEIGVRDTR